MHRLSVTLVGIGLLVACSSDGGDLDPDGGGAPDAGPSYSDADYLFEPDRLLEIAIELPEPSWDAIRFQTRNILELFGEDCGATAATSPFTYQEATVTIEGVTIENVGLRKKGFLGSLDDVKPSLKIKFNEYIAGQRFSGLKRMTLNNARQDPSFMNQCLGYALFNQAGVPAPRCNFAHVTINGRDMGVYVNIESVKKPFLAIHFDDNDGNLYEGTLSDFRDGWTTTFERKTNESVPPGSEDRSGIDAVVSALELGDAAMLTELDQLVDIDQFYRFWAVESMTTHGDGYSGNSNNFFIYGDPTTGKLSFLPWGADNLFGNGGPTQDPAATRSALARRLYVYPPTRAEYLAHYEDILDNVWDDAALLAEIDRIEALIESSITAERLQPFREAVARLRGTLTGREAILRSGLDNASANDAEELMDPLCFADIGQMTATFTATYAGGASSNVTLAMTLDGTPRTFSNVLVYAGPDDEKADSSVLIMTAKDGLDRDVIFLMTSPDSAIAPGTIDIGKGLVESVSVFTPPGAPNADEIYFLSGPLEMASGTAQAGSSWQGTLDLSVWKTPFF